MLSPVIIAVICFASALVFVGALGFIWPTWYTVGKKKDGVGSESSCSEQHESCTKPFKEISDCANLCTITQFKDQSDYDKECAEYQTKGECPKYDSSKPERFNRATCDIRNLNDQAEKCYHQWNKKCGDCLGSCLKKVAPTKEASCAEMAARWANESSDYIALKNYSIDEYLEGKDQQFEVGPTKYSDGTATTGNTYVQVVKWKTN